MCSAQPPVFYYEFLVDNNYVLSAIGLNVFVPSTRYLLVDCTLCIRLADSHTDHVICTNNFMFIEGVNVYLLL